MFINRRNIIYFIVSNQFDNKAEKKKLNFPMDPKPLLLDGHKVSNSASHLQLGRLSYVKTIIVILLGTIKRPLTILTSRSSYVIFEDPNRFSHAAMWHP